jgi:hypothetical protein
MYSSHATVSGVCNHGPGSYLRPRRKEQNVSIRAGEREKRRKKEREKTVLKGLTDKR